MILLIYASQVTGIEILNILPIRGVILRKIVIDISLKIQEG
jgi:hypothetical protein